MGGSTEPRRRDQSEPAAEVLTDSVALNKTVVGPKAELRGVVGIVDRDLRMRAVHAVDPACGELRERVDQLGNANP